RETEAGRMCSRDQLRSKLFRGAEFRKPEARHVGVDVYDVRGGTVKPLVKQFGAAHDDASLGLVARDPRRNRVAIHLEPVQLVRSLRLSERFRRGNQHVVAGGPQPLRQLGYVDFRAAIRRWEIPTSGLNDAQSNARLCLTRACLWPVESRSEPSVRPCSAATA